LDKRVVAPTVRVANHAAAIASLSYFGLISMTMMSLTPDGMPAMAATFRAVITRSVGTTSNQAFARQFGTLVTPANGVFLIWPVISALQLIALLTSLLRPSPRGPAKRQLPLGLGRLAGPPMTQSELTSLALANAFATTWLITASNAAVGSLPLGSVLALPLVPLLSGFPLRSSKPPPPYRLAFQVFSAFTTLATFLALAVELQHGGRVPFLLGRAEACAAVFLSLTAAVVTLPTQSLPKRIVNLFALSGILWRRLATTTATTAGSLAAVVPPLLRSPSFLATILCWAAAAHGLLLAIADLRRSKRSWSAAGPNAAAASQGRDTLPSPPPSGLPDDGGRGVFF